MRLLLSLAAAAALGAQPLRLPDVLDSVSRAYPPLLAALQDINIADAELLSALGKFDLTLRSRVDTDQLGFYRNERVTAGFEQPTQWWGSSFYGGWRVGDGSFAPYDGKLDTRSLGEWSGGLKLPLLRDRAIDSKRAAVRGAETGKALARLSIDQQKLVITQLATRRYWDWAAAGGRLQVAESLLAIAQNRDQFLREASAAGQIAAIEVLENGRALLQRRNAVVEAERGLQQAAIDLSLFYRDNLGSPVIVPRDRLPASFPQPDNVAAGQVERDAASAVTHRPEVQRLDAQERLLRIDERQARNERLPQVDFQMGFTAEGGQGAVRRGPNELKAGIVFELPFQRRSATGKLLGTEAKIRQVEQRQRFTRDQIEAEVRDAASAVQAAYSRAELLRQEVTVTRQLEEAERARFELGEGTLFLVNLREQATADALVREVAANADLQRAWAQYEFAVAAPLR
ncbi:MAG: TolC family protein [Acidobacteria bacterium]|nr:TolC family protein [Acidobacteriota bacterium]